MQQNLRTAGIAIPAKPGRLDDNVALIDDWAGKAAEQGAELVLFQELSLTGFIPNHPKGDHATWLRKALNAAREISVRLENGVFGKLRDVARRNKQLISVGFLEDAGNTLFNAQTLIDESGVVGHWRKMHIPMFETPFYNGGGIPKVVETRVGRIGVNICFDALLPESTRLLAINNAEIVLFPFAADPEPVTPEGWCHWAEPALRARCAENGIFGIACNYVGDVECADVEQSFPGGGLAVGPRGEVLQTWSAATGEPGMVVAEFSADDLRQARSEPEYLFRFRRPELYGPLTQ